MKRYLKNLMTAICGNDPYRMELDRVREEYGKTAERVRQLDEMRLTASFKLEETTSLLDRYAGRLSEIGRSLSERNGQVVSLQTLVDNLRERVAEKDGQIGLMKEEFRARTEGYLRRIADYSGQVARLQGELAKVKKRAARKAAAKKKEK